MNFLEAKKIMDEKLGDWKIMALASCVDNYPMVRNVSCVFYNDKIYFKTDKNFRKTQQLFKNPQVAMCFNGVQVEGKAVNKGLVVDEPGRISQGRCRRCASAVHRCRHPDQAGSAEGRGSGFPRAFRA